MLYDPKWEVEIKADPFSLDALIAWLEKQPADKRYPVWSHSQCMLAQWLKSMGEVSYPHDGDSYVYAVNGQRLDLGAFESIAFGNCEYTFGAALERARFARDNL